MSQLFKKLFIICLLTCFPVYNQAQEILGELAEQAMENSNVQSESLFEDLADYLTTPLNMNTATKEQLERFPFLSDQLVENILYYLYKYGPMLTSKELMMVEGMDRETINKLMPFITFQQVDEISKPFNIRNIIKYGKHELTARMDIPFYFRDGYKIHSQEILVKNPNKQYIGYPYHHNLRYRFHYSNRIYFGLTAENDGGEAFFSGKNKKGYDYYSPYFVIHDICRLKTLVLGNYRASYGYGLVMNSDFQLGKTATLNTLFNKSTGLKKHSSTDEYNYFQGIGVSVRLAKRWTVDAFYSFRNMDGKVDSLFITSLKKDGLHRLKRDYEKKNTFHNQVIGSHLNYNGKYYEFGLTTVYNVFNKVLKPIMKSYNKYYPKGRDFFNIGANYKLFIGKFTLLGETAIDKKGTVATLNMLRYSPNLKTQFIVMNRYYDAKYQSLYARSVSESGLIQNENAIYIGLETKVLPNINLTAYSDFFYFPFKKYLVSQNGTNGFDGLFQLSYSPSYQLNMFLRYRFKKKDKDYKVSKSEKQTIPYYQQRVRYQLDYRPNEWLCLKTTTAYNWNNYRYRKAVKGFLVSQSTGYNFLSLPLQTNLAVTWFDTDDYNSRIYLYEKGLLYSFSFPSFFYQGFRFALNTRYAITEKLIVQLKYGWTHYTNKESIGTGLDLINGKNKQDLYLQVRWKF